MRINRTVALVVVAATLGSAEAAGAEQCTRLGIDVTCDDGRRGILQDNAILWPDGTTI